MKRKLRFLAVTAVTVAAVISIALTVPFPAAASGAMQIAEVGYPTGPGDCTAPNGSDFATVITGDLVGCLYTYVDSAQCSPSGTYRESGHELFVGANSADTFRTTYKFEGKYQDCPNLAGEIVGRCHHPIVDGSGTGIYTRVKGRIHFKDDVTAGNFPYDGHLQY